MLSVPQLIVGLGNPGKRYDRTRHNAGFWFVDRLLAGQEVRFRTERRFHGSVAQYAGAERTCWVLKPDTFMNESGRSVQSFISFYGVPPEAVMVVHDEVDFPAGVIRLKEDGGHGGHNGLRDVVACIGVEFLRLRIGVGHPGQKDDVIEYVLDRPGKEEQVAIDGAIDRGLEVMPLILSGRIQQAMTALHTDPTSEEEP